MGLERLRAHRRKQHCVKPESGARRIGNGQMSQMRRVKAAAEEGHSRTGKRLLHLAMVQRKWGSGSMTDMMRILIALLALAGAAVSGLALQVHYSTSTQPCSINEKWDCGVVNHSPYAEIVHVPVAAIGIAGYVVMAGLALAGRRGSLAMLAFIGLAFSLYLTYIEAAVLEVWCLYCVISLGIITTVTLLSFLVAFRAKPAQLSA